MKNNNYILESLVYIIFANADSYFSLNNCQNLAYFNNQSETLWLSCDIRRDIISVIKAKFEKISFFHQFSKKPCASSEKYLYYYSGSASSNR